MSSDGSGREGLPSAGPRAPCGLHDRPFKLRFAPQRQLGRSYISATKPLGLPAIIKIKLEPEAAEEAGEQKAAAHVRALFARGPRDTLARPATTAQEYGWWWDRAAAPALRYHVRDSAWMKERLRVLAADASFKRL